VSATEGAIDAVQNALYGVLSADSTLAGLSLTADVTTVSVFGDVPEGRTFRMC
jgi:hypothetical protein